MKTHGIVAVLLLVGGVHANVLSGQEPMRQTIANWPAPAFWQPAAGSDSPETSGARVRTAAAAVISAPLPFVPVDPCRMLDTRSTGGAIVSGSTRDVTLTGSPCGIPPSAAAVSANFAVFDILGATGNGVLKVWPTGSPSTFQALVNWSPTAGQIDNASVVPLGTGGAISLQPNQGAGSIDLVIDVNGYYDGVGVATQGVTSNLLQIALLKWYPANRSTIFTVGAAPAAVAFDGGSVWVTNNSDATVTKLRASDGACVTPCTFSGGASPYGIAFDGANIWVANQSINKVTKLKASDGTNLGAFPVGSNPAGVAFDGANIWVANASSNNVTKLRASDGACVATCTFAVGTNPVLMAFDGTNIWVANYFSNSVTKLRASDGANLGAVPVGTNPVALAFDGANIWVVNSGANTVTKLRASDGVSLGTFPVSSVPGGIVFDGSNVWVSNTGSNTVTKLRASDGANLGTFNAGTVPSYLAFDGAHIWVTNFGGNTVTKL